MDKRALSRDTKAFLSWRSKAVKFLAGRDYQYNERKKQMPKGWFRKEYDNDRDSETLWEDWMEIII